MDKKYWIIIRDLKLVHPIHFESREDALQQADAMAITFKDSFFDVFEMVCRVTIEPTPVKRIYFK